MYFKALSLFSILLASITAQMATSQQQVFITGGGCANIPGVGSPILMVANTHKYIEDGLNIKNNYTHVKFIYFCQIPSPHVSEQKLYRMVFTITDYYGTKFIGMEFVVFPFGIGSVRINRFIFSQQFAAVKNFIDNNINPTNTISCGDLKFVYSSFGNDPTNDLDYLFAGRNQNSAGLAILNQLNSNVAKPNITRTCVSYNYIQTGNFFGAGAVGTPIDLLHCLPNENAIAAIQIGCNVMGVASLQLTYNNLNDNGTTASPYIGNASIPASAITTISLGAVDRISITSYSSPNSLQIQTLDINNNVLTNYQCGIGVATPQNVVVTTRDFLGFTRVITNSAVIQSFEVAQYNTSIGL